MIEVGGRMKRRIAVGAALGICALVGWQARALPDPAGAEKFHASVRAVVEKLPEKSGSWTSRDLPVLQAAVELLRPNVLHQRRWVDTRTGEMVTVLVVHCGDTRDLLGHYPPVCYVGQGWQQSGITDWQAELRGSVFLAPEYEFVAVRGGRTEGLWVRNAMLLPGKGLGRGMGDVQKAARNVTRRFFGAGQVQFVFPHDYTEAQRERISGEMMGIYGEVLLSVTGSTETGMEAGMGTGTATERGSSGVAGEGVKREIP